MSKKEFIDKMVAEIMEDFDFVYVRQVMVNLDWKWYIGDGKMIVPSTYRLKRRAESLLRDVAQHYGDKVFHSCGSDGFVAFLNGEKLTLQFVLTEITSTFHCDAINSF